MVTDSHEAGADGKSRSILTLELDFALLAPVEAEQPYYEAYVESHADDNALRRLAECLEAELIEAYHYKYCRDLGQLGPVRVMRVENGWKRFEETLVRHGQRSGNIKPVHLDSRTIWADVYRSAFPTQEI